MFFFQRQPSLITAENALPGRAQAMPVPATHVVNGRALQPPYPTGCVEMLLGMGCFWGAERRLWQQPGVWVTVVGYAGGFTPNPTYDEVCSGNTGHTEVVRVVYDPQKIQLFDLLRVFWESHDPTQGMRQGNDVGTQYRSAIYCQNAAQLTEAQHSAEQYGAALAAAGIAAPISTEIKEGQVFYCAEAYHQQYLAKNPAGYCGLRGTGIKMPG